MVTMMNDINANRNTIKTRDLTNIFVLYHSLNIHPTIKITPKGKNTSLTNVPITAINGSQFHFFFKSTYPNKAKEKPNPASTNPTK